MEKFLYAKISEKVSFQNLSEALSKQTEMQKEHMKHLRRLESEEDIIKVLHKILTSDLYKVCSNVDRSYKASFDQIYLKDDVFIYISKPALRYGLRQYFKCEFHSLKEIIATLSDAGILCEDSGAKTKKSPGSGGRHLCISLYAMEQYIKSIS